MLSPRPRSPGHVRAFVALLAANACEIPTLPAVAGDPIARPADTMAIITDHARPYPIHLYYLGDIHDVIREEMRLAANEWAGMLAPTPTAPFVFNTGVGNSIHSSQGEFTFTFDPGDTLAPGLHVLVLTTTRNTRGCGLGSPSRLHKYGRSDAGTQLLGQLVVAGDIVAGGVSVVRRCRPPIPTSRPVIPSDVQRVLRGIRVARNRHPPALLTDRSPRTLAERHLGPHHGVSCSGVFLRVSRNRTELSPAVGLG